MRKNFKQQAAQQRAAIPQIDPAGDKDTDTEMGDPGQPQPVPAAVDVAGPTNAHLTPVDTSEAPVNRGFSMFPSRHKQVAKDLAYIEDRNPWEIIEDALEEYVVRHYGKEHKRKQGPKAR
jgi:hypothetical protein